MIAVLAGGALACAVLMWCQPDGDRRLRNLLNERSHHRGPGRTVLVAAGTVALVVAVVLVAPGLLAWIVIVAVIGSTLAWVTRQHLYSSRAARQAAQIAQACQVIAAQLRIGRTPTQALDTAAQDCNVLAGCVSAQQIGADVADVLLELSTRPGCAGLANLSRAWRLCERTGGPLSPTTRRVADAISAERQLQSEIAAELAVPRATGKLLAMLPVVGVAMGFMAGGDPLSFLVSTLPGRACLAGAVLFACAGLLWTELIASRAVRRP